jgi:hypothetical protein
MDRITIPGDATYTPVALMDVALSAPVVSRLLLGATIPGRLVQAAALGLYAGSAARDWLARTGMRRINFDDTFGADVFHLTSMTPDERLDEAVRSAHTMNDGYVETRVPRRQLARRVNEHLTEYIALITGQRVETSSEIRSFTLARLVVPFAQGACDVLSGDVAIFRDAGIFEAHIIAHEFTHRKGYLKELHAQALAYLALRNSGDPILVQSARSERLYRQLRVLSGDDSELYRTLLERIELRPELSGAFRAMPPLPGVRETPLAGLLKGLYDARMKRSGQNGLSDYDVGFTNFLYTFRSSQGTELPPEHAEI